MAHENLGIPFLEISEFNIRYPSSNNLAGKGTHGNIYYTINNNFVVKVIEDEDNDIQILARELDIYSALSHPCIMRPEAWSHSERKGYIALPKGLNVYKAYSNGIISIEKIMNDTLSAIQYMTSLGIAHCDIKPDNIIYQDRKVKFIDLSLSKKCILSSDGNYYFKGCAYTPAFKDPEYIETQWNNISSELFALAATYYTIVTKKAITDKNIYTFKTGLDSVDWFISYAQEFQNVRKSIDEIMEIRPEYIRLEEYKGIYFREPLVNIIREYDTLYQKVLLFISQVVSSCNCRADTLFLTLHLFHRCAGIIFPEEPIEEDLKLLSVMCMDLACTLNEDKKYAYRTIMNRVGINYLENELNDMLINILKATNCIVTSLTYWNYAKSFVDLRSLLKDTLNFNYDPSRIRPLTGHSGKYVRANSIYSSKLKIDFFTNYERTQESIIYGCTLYLGPNLEEVKHYWFDFSKTQVKIAVLLHNREVLKMLDKELALKIYKALIDYDHDVILDILCKFDWRNENIKDYHPFK